MSMLVIVIQLLYLMRIQVTWCSIRGWSGWGCFSCPLLPKTETLCMEPSSKKAGLYCEVSFGITVPQFSLIESCHIMEQAGEFGCWKPVLCVCMSHINISLFFPTKTFLSLHLETESSQMTQFMNILLTHLYYYFLIFWSCWKNTKRQIMILH